MTEENKNQDGPWRERHAKKEEKKWEQAEQILSTVRSGWSLYIFRTKPSWCAGYLERIDLGDDEPIDMDYLIQEWGGHILHLRLADEQGKFRGNAAVKLMAYPVRHHGRRVFRSEYLEDDFDRAKTNQLPPNQQNLYQNPNQQQNPQVEMLNLLGVMQKARKEDLNLLQMIYQSHGASSQAPQGRSKQSAMKELLEMGSAYKELHGMFGEMNSSGGGGDAPQNEEMAMLGTVGDIVKSIYNRPREVNNQPAAAARVIPPVEQQQNAAAAQQQSPGQKKVDAGFAISSSMSKMPPEQVTDILLTSLSKMSDHNRTKVFDEFTKRTGLQIYEPEEVDGEGGGYEEERTADPPSTPSTPHTV